MRKLLIVGMLMLVVLSLTASAKVESSILSRMDANWEPQTYKAGVATLRYDGVGDFTLKGRNMINSYSYTLINYEGNWNLRCLASGKTTNPDRRWSTRPMSGKLTLEGNLGNIKSTTQMGGNNIMLVRTGDINCETGRFHVWREGVVLYGQI